MNNQNIFPGTCYMCGNRKFIVRVDSWASQKVNGTWVRGGYRNFCGDCVKEWNWEPNRVANTCLLCKGKFIGRKNSNVCNKCRENKNEGKN